MCPLFFYKFPNPTHGFVFCIPVLQLTVLANSSKCYLGFPTTCLWPAPAILLLFDIGYSCEIVLLHSHHSVLDLWHFGVDLFVTLR